MRRLGPAIVLVAAVGVFVAMLVSGRTRPMQSLVAFQAAGLMAEGPEQIDRVEVAGEGRRATLTRGPGGRWARAAGPLLADAISTRLDVSLKFMHAAAPVRVMPPAEYQVTALGEYGLAPPRYTVALHAGGRPVIAASFGAVNPQGLFQYVRVDGRDALYLLPVFVGREWEQVIDAVGTS